VNSLWPNEDVCDGVLNEFCRLNKIRNQNTFWPANLFSTKEILTFMWIDVWWSLLSFDFVTLALTWVGDEPAFGHILFFLRTVTCQAEFVLLMFRLKDFTTNAIVEINKLFNYWNNFKKQLSAGSARSKLEDISSTMRYLFHFLSGVSTDITGRERTSRYFLLILWLVMMKIGYCVNS
jgi:hypothetical protein